MALPELKSIILDDNEIVTTQASEGATVLTELNNSPMKVESFSSSGNPVITTHNVVPQVVTTLTQSMQDITTIVEGFWDVVWSVNGQTGDVTIDVVIGEFIPNNVYRKGAAITYEGNLYSAIEDFTSGPTFDPTSWTKIEPQAAIAFGLFEPNHHYYARQPIWKDEAIYVANEEFTSGAVFNPDDWTKSSGSAKLYPTTGQNTDGAMTQKATTDALDTKANVAEVDGIVSKIPAQASSSNQLADKAFVNSSVQTATANFRGNWEDWTSVPTDPTQYPVDYAGSRTPTVNDYLVVQDASDYTEETLEGTWRFKYSGVWTTNGKNGWNPEYQVNETPMTAAQLAALNSGITSTAVTKLSGIQAGAEVNVNADWNSVSGDSQILNKPGNATTSTDGLMSSADKTKLNSLNKDKMEPIGDNFIPSGGDIPINWISALSNGERVGYYTTDNILTNQPTRYGVLETHIGIGSVAQTFTTLDMGAKWSRSGNQDGWYIPTGKTTVWRRIYDDRDTNYIGTSQLVDGAVTSAKIGYRQVTRSNLNLGYKGNYFDKAMGIQPDGVVGAGRYVDFHESSDSQTDFDSRMQALNGNLSFSGDIYVGNAYSQSAGNKLVKESEISDVVHVGDSGSISTSMIADGAVTAEKIDFKTFNNGVITSLNTNSTNSGYWRKLGNITFSSHKQGEFTFMRIFVGDGNNSRGDQNAFIDLTGQLGWTGESSGRAGWASILFPLKTAIVASTFQLKIIANSNTNYDIWLKWGRTYCVPCVLFFPSVNNATTWTPDISGSWTSTEPSGTACDIVYCIASSS